MFESIFALPLADRGCKDDCDVPSDCESEGLAQGALVEAAEGGWGETDGLVLETVVSLVDSKRDDGAAIGTGDVAGRPTLSAPQS